MATSRGGDRRFRGPGRQKSWRKGKTSGDASRTWLIRSLKDSPLKTTKASPSLVLVLAIFSCLVCLCGLGSLVFCIYSSFAINACFLFPPFPASCVCVCVCVCVLGNPAQTSRTSVCGVLLLVCAGFSSNTISLDQEHLEPKITSANVFFFVWLTTKTSINLMYNYVKQISASWLIDDWNDELICFFVFFLLLLIN